MSCLRSATEPNDRVSTPATRQRIDKESFPAVAEAEAQN
jgi:hypothetical protein